VQSGQRREQDGGEEFEGVFHIHCSNEGVPLRSWFPIIPRAPPTVTFFCTNPAAMSEPTPSPTQAPPL
jgi:hypothetical protein